MPDPAKFRGGEKGKKRFMQKCIHQTVHKEKKDKEQGVAQCLNMWRSEHGGKKPPKKMATRVASMYLEEITGVRNAGLGSFLKGLISKIPGLPKLEEAKATLAKYLKEKGEGNFKKLIDECATAIEQLQKSPSVKEASIQDIMHNLKGLADPKILLAALTIFMSAGTTQAGPILNFIRTTHVEHQIKNMNQWVTEFLKQYKDADAGFLNIEGKDYVAGRATGTEENSEDMAMMNATAFAKANGKTAVQIVKSASKSVSGGIETIVLMTLR